MYFIGAGTRTGGLMCCSCIRCFIIRHTYDKPLFNHTLLHFYRCLQTAAAALEKESSQKKFFGIFQKKC